MMINKKTLLFLAAMPFAALADSIEIGRNGTLKIDGSCHVQTLHYSDKWVPNRSSDSNFTTVTALDGRKKTFRGDWRLRPDGKVLKFQQEIGTVSPDESVVTLHLKADPAIPTGAAALHFDVPSGGGGSMWLSADGKKIILPEKCNAAKVASFTGVKELKIALERGILNVTLPQRADVDVYDSRAYKIDNFNIRVKIDVKNRLLAAARLECRLKFTPYTVRQLDIAGAANMGFKDDKSDDRRGGWTDQGPSNDLRMFKAKEVRSGAVKVKIVDPALNKGNSCIVLGGGGRPYFPRQAAVKADGKNAGSLFLLHAIAWPPKIGTVIGKVQAEYTDGTSSWHDVVTGREVDNWWNPGTISRGVVGWSEFNGESPVGLYLCSIPLSGKKLNRVLLHSSGNAVWMICGMSVAAENVPLSGGKGFTLYRNANWQKLEFERHVEKGSALDFSFMQDAPAGKYGFLKVTPQGRFEFDKRRGERVRFYGANLCLTANFMEKKAAEELSERWARIGYNSIRLHHFDRDLMQRSAPDSLTFDTKQLDRLDYLIYCMKKRGIYVTIDLFTHRYPARGEYPNAPDLKDLTSYKLLAMIDKKAMDNLKAFSARLLNHVNPYTKLAWKDDPAFCFISMINENTISHIIRHAEPAVKKLYDDKFQEYCRRNNLNVSGEARDNAYRKFLYEVYDAMYKDLTAYLRSIGVKTPLTDQNFIAAPENTMQRKEYDYVDNHLYWDHPFFIGKAWSLPAKVNNCSTLAVRMRVPKVIAPSRIFGKPFAVTEFDFCYPNEFRAEGAPIFAAYAAMQDYDALYRFAYAHHWKYMLTGEKVINSFDVANDPVRLLGERLGMAFFVRGDIAPASKAFPVAVSSDSLNGKYEGEFPMAACDLSLIGRTGSFVYNPVDKKCDPALPPDSAAVYSIDAKVKNIGNLPVLSTGSGDKCLTELVERKIVTPAEVDVKNQRFTSIGGALTADLQNKIFTARSSRSAALVLPEKSRGNTGVLEAFGKKSFSVIGAITLDGKEFAHSSRILVLHLSDVKAEKITFADSSAKLMTATGDGDLLARHAQAEISLRTGDGNWKLYALNCSGRRLGEVRFARRDGKIVFAADTFRGKDVVFAYELVKLNP